MNKLKGRRRKDYRSVCLTFPVDFIEMYEEYASTHGCNRNEAIMRLARPESEREVPEFPDVPVEGDLPMACQYCEWWTAKSEVAGFCGLLGKVTTKVDGCVNFVEKLGEF